MAELVVRLYLVIAIISLLTDSMLAYSCLHSRCGTTAELTRRKRSCVASVESLRIGRMSLETWGTKVLCSGTLFSSQLNLVLAFLAPHTNMAKACLFRNLYRCSYNFVRVRIFSTVDVSRLGGQVSVCICTI